MHCSSHFNIKKKSYCKKIGNERRASIAQEGKGNARDGEQADGHTDIENNIKGYGEDKPQGKKKTKTIGSAKGNIQSF